MENKSEEVNFFSPLLCPEIISTTIESIPPQMCSCCPVPMSFSLHQMAQRRNERTNLSAAIEDVEPDRTNDRRYILALLQTRLFIQQLPSNSSLPSARAFLECSVDSVNEVCQKFNLNVILDEDSAHIICTTTDVSLQDALLSLQCEFDSKLNADIFLLQDEFLTSLMRRARAAIKSLCPFIDPEIVDKFHHQFTGGDAYEGDYMIEYEVNPMAGGHCVYFPNITLFTPPHIDRFTLSRPENIVEDVVFGLWLSDLPHEGKLDSLMTFQR